MRGISQLAKNFLDCHRVMQTKNMKAILYLKMSVTIYKSTRQDFIRECLLSVGTESFASTLLSKTLKVFRTIIFSVVLCGCETWLLALREERRLRMFENRVLRKIFEPKRDEEAGE
jgi:hypothetical protein